MNRELISNRVRNQYKVLAEAYEQIAEQALKPVVLSVLLSYNKWLKKDKPNIEVRTSYASDISPQFLQQLQQQGVVQARRPYEGVIGQGHSVTVYGKGMDMLPQMVAMAYKEMEPYAKALNVEREVYQRLQAQIKSSPQSVWEGTCNNACKGAWYEVTQVDKEDIREQFYSEINPLGFNASTGNQNKELEQMTGKPFPLPMYKPEKFDELMQRVNKGELVQFYDGEWFRVYGLNKATVTKRINEVLNSMEDWLGAMDY